MNETKHTACGCATCPGSACTCGCQEVTAKSACGCGPQCTCGAACSCNQRRESQAA